MNIADIAQNLDVALLRLSVKASRPKSATSATSMYFIRLWFDKSMTLVPSSSETRCLIGRAAFLLVVRPLLKANTIAQPRERKKERRSIDKKEKGRSTRDTQVDPYLRAREARVARLFRSRLLGGRKTFAFETLSPPLNAVESRQRTRVYNRQPCGGYHRDRHRQVPSAIRKRKRDSMMVWSRFQHDRGLRRLLLGECLCCYLAFFSLPTSSWVPPFPIDKYVTSSEHLPSEFRLCHGRMYDLSSSPIFLSFSIPFPLPVSLVKNFLYFFNMCVYMCAKQI